MATVTKTFTFATSAEGYVATAGQQTTLSYDAATGNPPGALKARKVGRNSNISTSYWDWIGTWEQLGVPVGATVTSIRLLSASTRCTEYNVGDASTIGPYEILDSTPAVIGTLWAGRAVGGTDAAWIATSAQSPVSIPSHASNTTITIRLNDQLATANNANAAISTYDDEVSLEITYSIAATAKTASDSGTLSATASTNVFGSVVASSTDSGSLSATDTSAVVKQSAEALAGTVMVSLANSTSLSAQLPAGYQPGQALLIFATNSGNDITMSVAGWTQIHDKPVSLGNSFGDSRISVFFKIAQASEPIPTVTASASCTMVTQMLAIPDGFDPAMTDFSIEADSEYNDWATLNTTTGPTVTPTASGLVIVTGVMDSRNAAGDTTLLPNSTSSDGNVVTVRGRGQDTLNRATLTVATYTQSTAGPTSVGWTHSDTASGQTAVLSAFVLPKSGTGSTPVTSSDSGTLSSTSTTSIASTASRTDTGTLSAVESTALFKTIASSDSGTLSVSDTSSTFKAISSADSGTLSLTDSSVVSNPVQSSDSGQLSATETSGVVVPSGRILLVVGDPVNLSTDTSGQAQYDHWTAAGYTITLRGAADGAPANINTAYDVVVISNSVAGATSMVGYDTATIPVLATGVRSPHSGYSLGSAINGPTQTTQYVKTQGIGDPFTPSDITTAQNVTMVDTAFNTRYVSSGGLGAGRHEIASVGSSDLTQLTITRYEAGDTMYSGTAPSKRAWIMIHAGSITGAGSRGWEFLDNALGWALYSGTPTPVAGADSGQISATETSSVKVFVQTADAGTLTTIDTSVTGLKLISATDTATLSAVEGRGIGVTSSAADSGTTSAIEASNVFANITLASSDTGTVSGTETSSIVVAGEIAIGANDTGTISAVDSAPAKGIGTAESGTLSSSESTAGVHNIAVVDSGTVSAIDIVVNRQITSGDTGAISATETAIPMLNRPLLDSGVILATDTSDLQISGETAKAATDNGTVLATEAYALSVTSIRPDSGTLSIDESAFISKTNLRPDSGTLSATEQADIYTEKAESAIDSGSLSATETASVEASTGPTGIPVQVWNGVGYSPGYILVWNGAAFVEPFVQKWDGSNWV